MGKTKKHRHDKDDSTIKYIILITAVLNLVRSVVDIIKNLTG